MLRYGICVELHTCDMLHPHLVPLVEFPYPHPKIQSNFQICQFTSFIQWELWGQSINFIQVPIRRTSLIFRDAMPVSGLKSQGWALKATPHGDMLRYGICVDIERCYVQAGGKRLFADGALGWKGLQPKNGATGTRQMKKHKNVVKTRDFEKTAS